MRIRDGHATIQGDTTEYTMPSGSVEIIADDGRTLLSITENKDGSIRVHAGHTCKHRGVILDDSMLIKPIASNCIHIQRPLYQ